MAGNGVFSEDQTNAIFGMIQRAKADGFASGSQSGPGSVASYQTGRSGNQLTYSQYPQLPFFRCFIDKTNYHIGISIFPNPKGKKKIDAKGNFTDEIDAEETKESLVNLIKHSYEVTFGTKDIGPKLVPFLEAMVANYQFKLDHFNHNKCATFEFSEAEKKKLLNAQVEQQALRLERINLKKKEIELQPKGRGRGRGWKRGGARGGYGRRY